MPDPTCPSGREEDWERALRAAFGPAAAAAGGEPEPALDAIERATGVASRILLADEPEDHSPLLRVGPPVEEPVQGDARYRVVGEIARGGVGVIVKARDVDLGRDVALKVLRRDLAGVPNSWTASSRRPRSRGS